MRQAFTVSIVNRRTSLNHTRWECKYHVVFIPKYRKNVLFGQIRRELGEVFHSLARQKESLIEEGHLMLDYVHMMLLIAPKYAVSQVVGYIKGKSAIHIAVQSCIDFTISYEKHVYHVRIAYNQYIKLYCN